MTGGEGVPAPLGFVLTARGGEVELALHGDRATRLVCHARSDPYALVLMGRLHYRLDARSRVDHAVLPKDVAEALDANDAALALAVFLAEGQRGLTRLEGEFCLVLWDGRARRLIARRDPLGAYPLFWTTSAGCTRFATGLRPLVAALRSRAVDLDYVADYLAGGWVTERADEACAYRDVQRVRADTVVTVDPATGAVHRERYWDWLAHVEDPGTDRMDDAAVRYRELLTEAVGARMSGVCAAHLSGGMDSTSICLLALDQLRAGPPGALPLHALALVYDRLPQLSRERHYVESVLQREAPDLMGHRIQADEVLDFDGFDDPPFHDEPFVRAPFFESQLAIMRAAVGAGAATVLTGEGGDDLLVVSGRHIADLARRGKIGAAWREARRAGAARNTSGGSIFYRQVVAPVSAGWRRSAHRTGAMDHDETSVPPWIAAGFARRYQLADRLAEQRRRQKRRPGSTLVWSDALATLETRVGDGYRMALAAPYGVSLSHPFLDPRVLGFALGALRRLAPEPAPQKPLLAAAMAGVLPDEIRLRPAKRGFNEVYSLGLHRHRAQLESLAGAGDEFGIVEPAPLLATIDEATLATAEPSRSRPMDMTLSLLCWLSRQERWQSDNPAPSEVHRVFGAP